MDQLNNLNALFVHEIQCLYAVESLLTEALNGLLEKATNAGLKAAIASHLAETEQHKTTLEFIAKQLKIDNGQANCPGLAAMLNDASEMLSQVDNPETMDAAIIASAQKIEHFEIASYGTVATYASMLGYTSAAIQLRRILEEEHQADTKLNFIALELVNEKAQGATTFF